MNFCRQLFCNILGLFDVVPNFFSPKVKPFTSITYEHGIYELPHELRNDLRLRMLGNEEILTKCLNV